MKRLLLATLAMSAWGTGVSAQTLHVTGVVGYLSEWQITGEIAQVGAGPAAEYAGELTMLHVGLCSHDGPEQKLVPTKLVLSTSKQPSQIQASLVVDGATCTLSGAVSNGYSGFMNCPGIKNLPVSFKVN